MLELQCINLKHRPDRMEKIMNIFTDQSYFKVNRFDAIKHDNGAIGCLSSHLEIVKQNIDKPYVIVIEDDLILNDTMENIYNTISLLLKNISKWEIFNGTPTYYSCKNPIVHSKIENTPFININWGQSTSFMIYSKKCYEKLINLLEKAKINYELPIDILISKNFTQTTYIYGNLFYQNEDWSDIDKRDNRINEYLKYQKNQERLLVDSIKEKIVHKKINFTIGIYGIFIGDYTIFYKSFVDSINKYFFPGVNKKIFIVTNKDLEVYDNTYHLKVSDDYIQFPFPTLFRFKYFKNIPEQLLKQIDYMFFLNGNAVILNKISFDDLPIYKSRFVFSMHDGYYDSNYNKMPYEKENEDSTAFIPYKENYKYNYVGGRLYGASTPDFIELCNVNYKNILIDLKKNYIAIWHDESYINRFFYDNNKTNYFLTPIEYHIPEEQINRPKFVKRKKIIYLKKYGRIKKYPKNKDAKSRLHTSGNKITSDLIDYYENNEKQCLKCKLSTSYDSLRYQQVSESEKRWNEKLQEEIETIRRRQSDMEHQQRMREMTMMMRGMRMGMVIVEGGRDMSMGMGMGNGEMGMLSTKIKSTRKNWKLF